MKIKKKQAQYNYYNVSLRPYSNPC